MNTHYLPELPVQELPAERTVLGVRPHRCWSFVSIVVVLSFVGGCSLIFAQSALPTLQEPSVILYERSGKRCAEVSWQNLPQSQSRLTWYLQEHSAGNIYTCLIAPQLDSTKSYELSFRTNLPLYHNNSASSHWVHPIIIETMERRYSAQAKETVSVFCSEDKDFVPSVFAERPVRMGNFLAALLYVARKDKSKEYGESFREALREIKPRILRNPRKELTVMDTLVRTRIGEPLRASDMAQIAYKYRQNHELDSSIFWYAAALRTCPRYAEAWYQRGHLYLHLNAFTEALYDFDQATMLDSSDYRAWGNRSVVLHRMSRHSEAVGSANKALAIKSDEHGTRFFRAVSYQALGDTASAAKDAKIIVQTYLDNGDNESNVLEGALELLWRITTVQEWRNYFREQADHSANDDRAKSAVMYWSQILHREPQNIEAVHKRCSCAVWGKLPSYEAYRYCDTLFRSMPFGSAALDGSLYELRGLQHKLEKRYDKALEDYATALRLRPDNAFTYILRSQTRFAMKQTADSVEQDIRRAVAVAKASAPNDKIIWQKAAEYFRVTNQFDSVVHYISHNIQHDSSDYSALHLRAFAFDELGKREAINDYSRCIALIESLEDKAKLFYENLAEHYSKRGRMKWIFDDSTAEEDFTTSLRIFPTESAFGLRGSWYQARHYYQEALRDYDSVLTRTPQSHDAIFSSAECYYFLKEYSKALQMLRRINLGSDSEISKQARGTVYYLRGVLKSNLGDGAGACMDFHLAAQAGSEEAQATLTKSCSDEEYEEE